jgi:beta-glucosidase
MHRLVVVPSGIRDILHWISKRYNSPPIYITENGVDCPNESSMSVQEALNDTFRIDFYQGHIFISEYLCVLTLL